MAISYQVGRPHKKRVWFSITIKTVLKQILDQFLQSLQAFKTIEANILQEDHLLESSEWSVLLTSKLLKTHQDQSPKDYIKIRQSILLNVQIKCQAFKEENKQDNLLLARINIKRLLIKGSQVQVEYLPYLRVKS